MGRAATEYFKHIYTIDPSLDAVPVSDLMDPIINDG